MSIWYGTDYVTSITRRQMVCLIVSDCNRLTCGDYLQAHRTCCRDAILFHNQNGRLLLEHNFSGLNVRACKQAFSLPRHPSDTNLVNLHAYQG